MPVLEMRSVDKMYGGVAALDDIDLEVERGQIVALLGPNGAGKSTAFELLLGLIQPADGEVRVLGQKPGGSVRKRVGAMLQKPGLPEHVTVRELVRLIGRSYPASVPVDDVLRRTALSSLSSRIVTELSGGEQQRLQLALALVGDPEVLLLDEPTAALDVASRRAFWNLARTSVDGGATILFATHDLAEAAAVADRIVVVHEGRIIANGTPNELTEHGSRDLEDVFLMLTEETGTTLAAGGWR